MKNLKSETPMEVSGRQKHKNLLREWRLEKACLLIYVHRPTGESAINYFLLPVIGAIKRVSLQQG